MKPIKETVIALVPVLTGLSIFVPFVSTHPTLSSLSHINDPTAAMGRVLDSLLSNYDKRLRPNYGGSPVKVELSLYALDMYNVDEINHEFTVDLYFRQHWKDSRLSFAPPPTPTQVLNHIPLDAESMKNIWIPDTFIVNARSVKHHEIGGKVHSMMRIESDGSILMSQRLTVTATCAMDLKWFPFDRQTCILEFESYGFSAADVEYAWKPTKHLPFAYPATFSSPNMELSGYKASNASISLSTGQYSRLGAEFFLIRTPTRYLQDIYFPAVALPILAFLSLTVGAPQFRVLLSTINMTGIVIFAILLSSVMPKVTYQTALDFYVFNSSVMILNAAIVNFVVYLLQRAGPTRTRLRMQPLNGDIEEVKDICEEGSENIHMGAPKITDKARTFILNLCESSKWSMPVFFVIFNIIYWIVVLSFSNEFPEDFIIKEDRSE